MTGRHRRFFDIDELAGVRQEDPEVFEATHGLVLRARARRACVDGLRIDHPDGLADPAGYLRAAARRRRASTSGSRRSSTPASALRDWPVEGTVGYEFLNDVAALFVDPAGEAAAHGRCGSELSGDPRTFAEVAHEAKLEQARGTFAPEVERLARELRRELPGTSWRGRWRRCPSTAPTSSRTPGVVDEQDRDGDRGGRAAGRAGAAAAARRSPAPPAFVTRFQQTTPAVMAKGVEDTAFYRYGRLLALNEVGGDPARFGIDVETLPRAPTPSAPSASR